VRVFDALFAASDEVTQVGRSWRWPWRDQDTIRGRTIDPEVKAAITTFMNLLANQYPYIVEELRLRYGDLSSAVFYRGSVSVGVIANVMCEFPDEALVAAMELARVSPWAALMMALMYSQTHAAANHVSRRRKHE